ncbi:MAG: ABC transporter permease [Lachnospiraceae bacterium]|nr:ABC transporter permease [Lachnospiraceae bacterium]
MRMALRMALFDGKRRMKDPFFAGYTFFFPVLMGLLLGYLFSNTYGKTFTSYQYYGIVTVPFGILMSVVTVAYAAKDEAYKKTAVRFLLSPMTNAEIVAGKLLSCTAVIGIYSVVAATLLMLVMKVPVAGRIGEIVLFLFAETFAACALGLLIGYGCRNFLLIKNVLNIPIALAAIIGGSFYPIGSLNPRLSWIFKLSPMTYVNEGLFECLYEGDGTLLAWAMAGCMGVGIVCAVLAVLLFDREEYKNGELPSYEK